MRGVGLAYACYYILFSPKIVFGQADGFAKAQHSPPAISPHVALNKKGSFSARWDMACGGHTSAPSEPRERRTEGASALI